MTLTPGRWSFPAVALLAATLASFAFGLDPSHWQYRQELTVNSAGLVRIAVPLQSIDRAQPELGDLRLVDTGGVEVPFALLRPQAVASEWEPPLRFRTALVEHSTVVTLETGRAAAWEAVELITTSPSFLKPARIERSDDGKHWEEVANHLPYFRQDGVQQTTLPLGGVRAAMLRVTLSDERQAPVPITGARLLQRAEDLPVLERLETRIVSAQDYADETQLTLELPAANLDVHAFELSPVDSVFMRNVEVSMRQLMGDEITLTSLGSGSVHRVRAGDSPLTENLQVPLGGRPVSAREVVLRVHNGDSPPLKVSKVALVRRVAHLVFHASAPGTYVLWSGNPDARRPRYDVAALTGKLRDLPVSAVAASPLSQNPTYSRPDPLAGLILEGAMIDVQGWRERRSVQIQTPGVQLLDLDLSVLARLQPSLADLRLVRADKQVPFVVERPNLERSLEVPLHEEPDPRRPQVGRWRLQLPYPSSPVTELTLESDTPMFERTLSIFERRQTSSGATYNVSLGGGVWRRVPGAARKPFSIKIGAPQGDTIWIETDNGENQPIALRKGKVGYPVVRVLFRTSTAEPILLLVNNPAALMPRYDLSLVAPMLIASSKHVATLAPEVERVDDPHGSVSPKAWIFWIGLGAVVVVLLSVVAWLIPKADRKD